MTAAGERVKQEPTLGVCSTVVTCTPLLDCQGYDTLDVSVFNAKLWEASGDRYRNRNAQGAGRL
jgi:hypothetical protein